MSPSIEIMPRHVIDKTRWYHAAMTGKAYWRIIQGEIEAKGWTVSRAVRVQGGGDMLHVATARKGKHRCVVTADSELGAMVALQKEIGEIRVE